MARLSACRDRFKHKPRLEKIGIKPDWHASAVGDVEPDFLREVATVVTKLVIGRALKRSDAIFFGPIRAADLVRLRTLTRSLKPNGALWVIRPKGHPEISERAVMTAGKAAGLVDIKVVSFSSTHSALKFVIPVANR
jgi:hypothetical protein